MKRIQIRLSAENPLTAPFIYLFYFVSLKVGYTFAVALVTSIGGFLIAGYIAIFLAATVNFSETQTASQFLRLFIILCFAEYAPLYFLHFGMMSKLKIPAFTAPLRLINKHIRYGRIRGITNPEVLVSFYEAIESLPMSNMLAAGIYPTIVMIAVTVQELIIGSMKNAFFLFVGIGSAIGIYIFFTYVIAELLTGDLRRKVKRIMVMRKISFQERSFSSIRRKFVFISFLVLMAMIELGLMFINQQSDSHSFLPWLYIIMTVVVVGSLMYFYLVSIEDALKEIESAAIDLGRGGRGKLYGRSLDKEFIRMSNGIISAAYEVNEVRNNLEKKVNERTEELQKSLIEIKQLKEKQDGDYFLISLLTDALNNINQARNTAVKVEFIVQEKKKFTFRKWEREIGGDMCMSYTIYLKGRPYTMFLNADAMGKSIQGAGGILVMGSVVKYLAETNLRGNASHNRTYPEFWIRNTYIELQHIFESFAGSMLMSMVLGLVDEKTGLTYFINAEHPWMAIYRDGKACFIENDLTLRKIGTQGIDQKIMIQLYQLREGDILIAGSDGRDDIFLGMDDDTQNRIINEDETLFLRNIEKSGADLGLLLNEITQCGELTDDLSLMRIIFDLSSETTDKAEIGIDQKIEKETMYLRLYKRAREMVAKGQYSEALGVLGNRPERHYLPTLNLLIKIYMKMKNYGRAYFFAEMAHRQMPTSDRFLYIASLCAKKIGNWKKALEQGERLHLRNPRDVKNLINLADIYRLAGQRAKAEELFAEASSIDESNIFIQRLQKML